MIDPSPEARVRAIRLLVEAGATAASANAALERAANGERLSVAADELGLAPEFDPVELARRATTAARRDRIRAAR